MKYNTAVFPGSFNPFHIGHQYVVNEALKVFDKVIILFAHNSDKEHNDNISEYLHVMSLYEDNPDVIVDYNTGLTAKYCLEHNACLIRGIRNTMDFEYEKNIDIFNSSTYNVPTYFVITPPRLSHISSSLIRSLQAMDEDTANNMLPVK